MYTRKFQDFLVANGGVTSEAIKNLMLKEENPLSSAFFKPYQSAADVRWRATSIVTAPIVFTLSALECAVDMLCYATTAMIDLVTLNPRNAAGNLDHALFALLCFVISVVAIALSPIINAVDMIGSDLHEEKTFTI